MRYLLWTVCSLNLFAFSGLSAECACKDCQCLTHEHCGCHTNQQCKCQENRKACCEPNTHQVK